MISHGLPISGSVEWHQDPIAASPTPNVPATPAPMCVRRRRVAALVISALACSFGTATAPRCSAQSPLEQAGPIAINLDEFRDWNPTFAFTDAMKQARPFVSQPIDSVQPFDDGQPMPTDAIGWPLPAPGQAAASLLWSELGGNYPAGTYDLYWEGTGEIVLGLDATLNEAVGPGHARYDVAPTYQGILIKILSSDGADPIRNIRLMMPGFADEATAPTFHPDFLDALEPFGVVRVMQWQNINFTTVEDWAERPTPGDATQATERGVSAEYLVELGNTTGKAIWLCIPRLATDDYVRQFARFVAENLDPSVPVYLEWSNEVWNGAFLAYWYALAQGQAEQLPGTDFEVAMTWYTNRSLEVFDIWSEEFESFGGPTSSDRIVRVLASQHDNPYVAEIILDHDQAYTKCDALATAPYFGSGYGYQTPEELSETLLKTESEILADLEAEVLGPLRDRVLGNTQVANDRGLPHIAYEAGQHLVAPGGFFADPDLSAKFVAVNRDPGMYGLYRTFLDVWNAAGGELMTPYSLATRFSSYGNFGHLEYLGQPLADAHKLRAVLDWADELPIAPEVTTFGEACDGLVIGAEGAAVIGSGDFAVQLSGAGPRQPVVLHLGRRPIDLPLGLPSPLVAVTQDPTCQALVVPASNLPATTDSLGSVSHPLPIPDQPALVGSTMVFQWAVYGGTPETLAAGLSNGLLVVVGG